MWFKKKKQPFVPLSMEQVMTLDLKALKKYQQEHARYVEESIKANQERVEAEIRASQEQADVQDRERQERMRRDYEETQRKLQEIFERNMQQMAAEREKTTNMMQRAFSDPTYLEALQQALTPQPPAVPQLGNEQIIEGGDPLVRGDPPPE